MLSWIADKPSAELALAGTLLTANTIKPLKDISNACLGETWIFIASSHTSVKVVGWHSLKL